MSHDFTPPGGGDTSRPVPSRTEGAGIGGSGTRDIDGPAPSMFRAGRSVATAAWIAIAAGVALLIGISWAAALAWADKTSDSAQIGDTGSMSAAQVVPGMCLEQVGDDGDVRDVVVVSCHEPHRAEVFTKMNFDLAKYPGASEVTSQALDYCRDRLEGVIPEGATWVAWTPSEQSWSRGDREALCVAVFNESVSEPLSPAGKSALNDDDRGGSDDESPEPGRSGQDV